MQPRTGPAPKPTSAAPRRYCDNPICGARIGPDQSLSVSLTQARPEGPFTWRFCYVECLRTFLTYCDLKERTARDPEDGPEADE
jgi:hypothetical protein